MYFLLFNLCNWIPVKKWDNNTKHLLNVGYYACCDDTLTPGVKWKCLFELGFQLRGFSPFDGLQHWNVEIVQRFNVVVFVTASVLHILIISRRIRLGRVSYTSSEDTCTLNPLSQLMHTIISFIVVFPRVVCPPSNAGAFFLSTWRKIRGFKGKDTVFFFYKRRTWATTKKNPGNCCPAGSSSFFLSNPLCNCFACYFDTLSRREMSPTRLIKNLIHWWLRTCFDDFWFYCRLFVHVFWTFLN